MDDLKSLTGNLILATLSAVGAYQSLQALTTGEYQINSNGRGEAGAALINFIGDMAGPYAVSLAWGCFAAALGIILYAKLKKS